MYLKRAFKFKTKTLEEKIALSVCMITSSFKEERRKNINNTLMLYTNNNNDDMNQKALIRTLHKKAVVKKL